MARISEDNAVKETRGRRLTHWLSRRRLLYAVFDWKRVLHRLLSSWPSSDALMLAMYAMMAMLAITPFAVARWIHDGPDWIVAALAMLAVLFALSAVFVRQTNRIRLTGTALAMLASGAVIAGIAFNSSGLPGVWALVFPVIMANFFVTDTRLALSISVIVVVLVLLNATLPAVGIGKAVFISALICLALLSLLFSWHANRQQHQLGLLARRDPLTGAGNRRSLQMELQARIVNRIRGEQCSIALMDLDKFKSLNDSFGHEFGDRVLVSVVDIAEQTLRSGDRIYRFGGDEFAIVFPGTPRDGVAAALSKLQEAIEQHFKTSGASVSVSIGAACLEPDEAVDDWLRRADCALYMAKRAGRDRFWIDDPDEPANTLRRAISASPNDAGLSGRDSVAIDGDPFANETAGSPTGGVKGRNK